MHDAPHFLRNLALVLCVAAATTVVFQRLRQPVIFGYLLAGLIIGPHIPVPLVADAETIHTLSELGVILLMFGLGLEFSLRKLIQVIPTAGIIAVLQSSVMIWLGYLIGRAFGWTQLESVYAGAAIAISSTTIIVKAFAEQGARGRFTDIVFGILIIEDIIAIFLLAILTTVSAGTSLTANSLGMTAARLATFLIGLTGVGLLIIPRLVRAVVKLDRPETTLVTSVGICFAAALLALSFGYSVALGAFIAGSLVAESGEEKVVEKLVGPVRDMFAAVFFVAVGMMIEPAVIGEHWVVILLLTAVVVLGKVVAVTIGTFLMGYSPKTSIQSGMSLAQIGEFSFIIAGVGLSSGATRPFLYPIAIAVSALTTLITPWLIRASGPTAAYVDRKLPHALQTFVSLYGSWIERMRSAPREQNGATQARRRVWLIVADTALIIVLVIGTVIEIGRVTALLVELTGISAKMAQLAVYSAAALVSIPLIVGLVRSARVLGLTLAARALPAVASGAVDIADAPRRALVVTLQFAILCLAGIPIVVITQPFLPPVRSGAVLIVTLTALGIAFWRSATNLHGHARAGAEIIVSALSQQMASPDEDTDTRTPLVQVNQILPGLGEPVRVRIRHDSPAEGRTLAQLNLRGLTGATVLAVTRGEERIVLPVGREVLHAGDVLALAGTEESVDAAIDLLRPQEPTTI